MFARRHLVDGVSGGRIGTTCHFRRFEAVGVVPAERFAHWRSWYSEAVSGAMRLEPVGRAPSSFGCSVQTLEAGPVAFVEVVSDAIAGTWEREATEADDLLRIGIFARGSGMTARWHGSDRAIRDGSPYLLGRTGGGYRAPAGFHTIQLFVPRAAIGLGDDAIERVTNRQVPDGLPTFEAVIRPLLLGVAGRLETLPRRPAQDLADLALSAGTLLIRALADRATDGEAMAPVRRRAAREYIAAHLADPGLGPDDVARALHVSRRALYAAFAGDGGGEGVAAVIRRARLERARALLADPRNERRPIGEVGAAVGLPNPALFCRLFRGAYGQSPREFRATARAAS